MSHFGEHAEGRGVHEIAAVGAADVHLLIVAGLDHAAKGGGRVRQMQGRGKVVAGSGGQDSQGDAAAGAHEAVDDLVDGAVAAAGDDEVAVFPRERRRGFRGVAPGFSTGDADVFRRAAQQQPAGDQLQLLLHRTFSGVGIYDNGNFHGKTFPENRR